MPVYKYKRELGHLYTEGRKLLIPITHDTPLSSIEESRNSETIGQHGPIRQKRSGLQDLSRSPQVDAISICLSVQNVQGRNSREVEVVINFINVSQPNKDPCLLVILLLLVMEKLEIKLKIKRRHSYSLSLQENNETLTN